MISVRKFLGFVIAALALGTFALPANAGNDKKQYSLDMEIVTAPPAQAPFKLTAKITNEGNSTVNSLRLFANGLTITSVDPPATGTPAGPFPGSSVSVTNMHPLKSGDSLTLTLYVSSCGDGTWTAAVWTGAKLNGQMFNLDSGDSNLATSISCGLQGTGEFAVPNSLTTCGISGFRGDYDKNGAAAVPVEYFVTNTVSSDGHLHFRWPFTGDNSDPAAAFDYTVCGSGQLPPETDVAWFNQDGTPATGTSGTPDFINAATLLNCLAPPPSLLAILPVPYGALSAYADDAVTTITVDTTSPLAGMIAPPPLTPTAPSFDIVIGGERMTVTACRDSDDPSGGEGDQFECQEHEGPQVWTVTRHVGGTHATSHDPGALVMYTPLPIMAITQGLVSEYKAGDQAQMCIVQRWYDSESDRHYTEFIDIGDGWGSHP